MSDLKGRSIRKVKNHSDRTTCGAYVGRVFRSPGSRLIASLIAETKYLTTSGGWVFWFSV